MIKGGDLYELAKILGHSNNQNDRAIREVNTARAIWKLTKGEVGTQWVLMFPYCSPRVILCVFACR